MIILITYVAKRETDSHSGKDVLLSPLNVNKQMNMTSDILTPYKPVHIWKAFWEVMAFLCPCML